MNRIATALAAAVAAFLLATPSAWADDAPVVTDLMTGEVVECFDAPYELEPGVWDCVRADDAAEWGFDAPAEEPDDVTTEDEVACLVVVEDGCDSIGDPVTGSSWDEDGYDDEATVVSPVADIDVVSVVTDNGGWGWSDARESYSA